MHLVEWEQVKEIQREIGGYIGNGVLVMALPEKDGFGIIPLTNWMIFGHKTALIPLRVLQVKHIQVMRAVLTFT